MRANPFRSSCKTSNVCRVLVGENSECLLNVSLALQLFSQFEEVSDGRQLVIIGVTNLTIRGRGLETPVRVRPRYAAVLSFRWVQGLRLESLHLSHTDETGYFTGAVLQFRVGCRDIHIEQCQLLGSGSYGLCLEGVENLTLTDSVITDCTYGGFSIDQSRRLRIGVRVERCVFGLSKRSQ